MVKKKWFVTSNADKTKSFSRKKTGIQHPDVYFNGTKIAIEVEHTHLGITLRNDCKWNNHVENNYYNLKGNKETIYFLTEISSGQNNAT